MVWSALVVPARFDERTLTQIERLNVGRVDFTSWGHWGPPAALVTPDEISHRSLGRMLELLVWCNVDWLWSTQGRAPSLYRAVRQGAARYIPEQMGQEEWLAIPWILARGGADCEDLCAWRVAELRMAGEHGARCIWSTEESPGKLLIHIRVRRGDGSIEDPSLASGMGRSEPRPWRFQTSF